MRGPWRKAVLTWGGGGHHFSTGLQGMEGTQASWLPQVQNEQGKTMQEGKQGCLNTEIVWEQRRENERQTSLLKGPLIQRRLSSTLYKITEDRIRKKQGSEGGRTLTLSAQVNLLPNKAGNRPSHLRL